MFPLFPEQTEPTRTHRGKGGPDKYSRSHELVVSPWNKGQFHRWRELITSMEANQM